MAWKLIGLFNNTFSTCTNRCIGISSRVGRMRHSWSITIVFRRSMEQRSWTLMILDHRATTHQAWMLISSFHSAPLVYRHIDISLFGWLEHHSWVFRGSIKQRSWASMILHHRPTIHQAWTLIGSFQSAPSVYRPFRGRFIWLIERTRSRSP